MAIGIGAIASGIGSLINTGIGIADKIKSKKEYNKAQSFFEQNRYDVPASATAALGVAQRNASSYRMPGQDLAEQRMGQNTASGVEQARRVGQSPSDVLAMLGNLYSSQNLGEQNLAMQGANQYQSNQRNFQNALNQYSQLEDQKWQYNVLYPYQQMLGRAAAFGDRGTQEMNTGFMGLGQTAALYSQENAMNKQYEAWKQQQFGGAQAPIGKTGYGMGDMIASRGANPLAGAGTPGLNQNFMGGGKQMNAITDWWNTGEYRGY